MSLEAKNSEGATAADARPSATPRKPFYRHLYVQVLAAIALGALFGWLAPKRPRKTG